MSLANEKVKRQLNKRKLGAGYEELACQYLKKKNMRILARNWHAGKLGELDIVAKDGKTLVFVEVKFRSNTSCGSPLEAIDARKRMQLGKLAMCYMKRGGISFQTPCRFDCIGFTDGDTPIHIMNAFSL